MRSVGTKRSPRVFGGTILRSGRRLFATQEENQAKRIRVSPVAVVDTEEHRAELLDHGGGGDAEGNENGQQNLTMKGHRTHEVVGTNDQGQTEIKLGESKKVNRNGTDEEKQRGIELGESKKIDLVDHHRGEDDNVRRNKKFVAVYSRKRGRMVPRDSSLNCSSCKWCETKYSRKKVRISLVSVGGDSQTAFVSKDFLYEVPVVFVGPSSYNGGDSTTTTTTRLSCFVSLVLRYMTKARPFSWRQFSSFLLSDPITIGYFSAGIRVVQGSTCTTSRGFFKVFSSVLSMPFFTIELRLLPFCFLYMHSNLLLKYAFVSYALITHLVDENVAKDGVDVPPIVATESRLLLYKLVVPQKARSGRRTVPRVSLFTKCSRISTRARVNNVVPIPGVHEIAGYTEEGYAPFQLPDSYIRSRSDEVTRTLERIGPVYEMDSDDEEWLKTFDTEPVSEDTFEKVVDAFERGIYCNPDEYSNAALAIDRCPRLASKEILEAVYHYWRTKRKNRRSALVKVFRCYRRQRVKRYSFDVVLRKKRSCKRRATRCRVENELDFLKALLNDQRMVEEAAAAIMKVHETQEAARRLEAAAIVKRQTAQAVMETADLVMYRANMSLRIAEARAAAGPVDAGLVLLGE